MWLINAEHLHNVPGRKTDVADSAWIAQMVEHGLVRPSRAVPGNIGLCLATTGPGGTDTITGLYSAWADSVPLLVVTGQAPVAKLHKEDFQAVDIAAIAEQIGYSTTPSR